ncbi:CsdB, Selenocysteine lyase, partial [Pyrenophora tritici-repentis]
MNKVTKRLQNTSMQDAMKLVGYDLPFGIAKSTNSHFVLGSSTTQLFMNLSASLQFPSASEIILSKMEHETNVKPWLFMAERLNLTVKWWESSKEDGLKLTAANLKPLLNDKVKFVACTHVSNILGSIHDVKSIADAVHEVGALFCVDGVSYAPHRAVDVKAFGVDFYSFSWYKVYGPHIAVLYASDSAQQHMKPMSHYFNPTKTLEDKIGFAGSNYECVQSIPAIVDYLSGAFPAITEREGKLQTILLDFLNSRPDITVLGSTSADNKERVPTISFTVKGMSSKAIVAEAEKISNYGFRWGHFYSKRLCDEVLGLEPEGVTRVSMVHYNTEEEIKGLVEVLRKVLPQVICRSRHLVSYHSVRQLVDLKGDDIPLAIASAAHALESKTDGGFLPDIERMFDHYACIRMILPRGKDERRLIAARQPAEWWPSYLRMMRTGVYDGSEPISKQCWLTCSGQLSTWTKDIPRLDKICREIESSPTLNSNGLKLPRAEKNGAPWLWDPEHMFENPSWDYLPNLFTKRMARIDQTCDWSNDHDDESNQTLFLTCVVLWFKLDGGKDEILGLRMTVFSRHALRFSIERALHVTPGSIMRSGWNAKYTASLSQYDDAQRTITMESWMMTVER